MFTLADFTTERIQLILLIFVRTTAILTLLPIFGSATVPAHIRVGLAFFLTIMLAPFVPLPGAAFLPHNLPQFFYGVIREVFVGVTIGFAASFLFSSIQFAGQLIDSETGFGMIELFDPFQDDVAVTVVGQLKMLLFSMIFLMINGHYFLLLAIQKSFEVIPLMQADMAFGPLSEHFVAMVGQVFVLAFRFAAPVYVVLVLTSLSFAIVARTVPQMNVYFIGMPVKIFVGLFTLGTVLPIMVVLFRQVVQDLITQIYTLLYILA